MRSPTRPDPGSSVPPPTDAATSTSTGTHPLTSSETKLPSAPTIETDSFNVSTPSHPPQSRQPDMLSFVDSLLQRAEQEGALADAPAYQNAPGPPLDDVRLNAAYSARVESLRRVRAMLDQLCWSDPLKLLQLSEALAGWSRAPEWRAPLGESGVLDFYLLLLAADSRPQELLRLSLRLIGNACADTEENRRRVVEGNHLAAVLGLIRDPFLVHIALSVVYNICLDFEPARRQALDHGIVETLIRLLSDHNAVLPEKNVLESICRLLEELIPDAQAIDASPENAVELLLATSSNPAVELPDFVSLVNLAIAHLASPRFQQLLVRRQGLQTLLCALVQSYSRFERSENGGFPSPASDPAELAGDDRPSEDARMLSRMRDGAIEALSNVSAVDGFLSVYPLDSPLVGSLRVWLSVPQTQLQVCASLMLGNLARSHAVCAVMVHDFQIHKALIHTLKTSDDAHVLHAAVGFLKNLALLGDNKDVIGQHDLFEVASRLWAMDGLPQLQYGAAALTRQAVIGSYRNIQRLLDPLSADPDSPAHSRTYLSLLLYLCNTTDQMATKTETARTIAAILRVLHSPALPAPAPAHELAETRRRLYQFHPDLARPLGVLASQAQPSVVRSEAWFAFALMAREKAGAAAVDDVVTEVEVVRIMVEIVTGREISRPSPTSDEQGGVADPQPLKGIPLDAQRKMAEMKRIDRENGLVLLSKLLENRGDDMPVMRREIFQDLLHGKDSFHLSYGQLAAAAAAARDPSTPARPVRPDRCVHSISDGSGPFGAWE
ncbi:MAG: hypothetical protein M1826_001849 [Phylliscum demangeonii]|nr:MAG: hypothetical protein M1826_001849 [Phylliscum demangeonii]